MEIQIYEKEKWEGPHFLARLEVVGFTFEQKYLEKKKMFC